MFGISRWTPVYWLAFSLAPQLGHSPQLCLGLRSQSERDTQEIGSPEGSLLIPQVAEASRKVIGHHRYIDNKRCNNTGGNAHIKTNNYSAPCIFVHCYYCFAEPSSKWSVLTRQTVRIEFEPIAGKRSQFRCKVEVIPTCQALEIHIAARQLLKFCCYKGCFCSMNSREMTQLFETWGFSMAECSIARPGLHENGIPICRNPTDFDHVWPISSIIIAYPLVNIQKTMENHHF